MARRRRRSVSPRAHKGPTSQAHPAPLSPSAPTTPRARKRHHEHQTQQPPQQVQPRRMKTAAKRLAEEAAEDSGARGPCALRGATDAETPGAAAAAGDARTGRKRLDFRSDVKSNVKTSVKSDARSDDKSTCGEKAATASKSTERSVSQGTVGKAEKPAKGKAKACAKDKADPTLTKGKKKKTAGARAATSPAPTVTAAPVEEETRPKEANAKEKEVMEIKSQEVKVEEVKDEEKKEENQGKEEATTATGGSCVTSKSESLRELFIASDLYSSGSDIDGNTLSEIRADMEVEVKEATAGQKVPFVEDLPEDTGDELPEDIQLPCSPFLSANEMGDADSDSDPQCAIPASVAGNDTISVIIRPISRKQHKEKQLQMQLQQQHSEETVELSYSLPTEKEAIGATACREKGTEAPEIEFHELNNTETIVEQTASHNESRCDRSTNSSARRVLSFPNDSAGTIECDLVDGDETPFSSDMLFSNQDSPAWHSEIKILSAQVSSSCMQNMEDVCVSLPDIPDDDGASFLLSPTTKNNDDAVFNWSEAENRIGWSYLNDCKSEPDVEYSKHSTFYSLSLQNLSCNISKKIDRKTNESFSKEIYDFVIGDGYFDFEAHRHHPIPMHRVTADLLKRKGLKETDPDSLKEIRFDDNMKGEEIKSYLSLGRKELFSSSSSSDVEISCVSSEIFENTFLLISPALTDPDASNSVADISLAVSKSSPTVSTSYPVPCSAQTTTCSFSFPEDTRPPYISPRGSPNSSRDGSFDSLSAAVSANASTSVVVSEGVVTCLDAWDYVGCTLTLDSAALSSAQLTPVSTNAQPHDSIEECTLRRSGCNLGSEFASCSRTDISHRNSANSSHGTRWRKEASCSESHSSVCVFLTSTCSKSSSLEASALDTVDDVSSSEFFSDSGLDHSSLALPAQGHAQGTWTCAAAFETQNASDSQIGHWLAAQEDALAMSVGGCDDWFMASLLDEPEVCNTGCRSRGTASSTACSASAAASTWRSVSGSAYSDGAESASGGSSCESLVTAESCCSDSPRSEEDAVVVVMCCSESSCVDSENGERLPAPPRISHVCVRRSGRAGQTAAVVAGAVGSARLRTPRFAPDLVSDLPGGCSAAAAALSCAARRDARHRWDCVRKSQAMERRPESAPPPTPGDCSECVVGAPLKDRIQIYKSAVAAPLSRPASAQRCVELGLGTSSTRVRERVLAFNAGLLAAAPGDAAVTAAATCVVGSVPASQRPLTPLPCDRGSDRVDYERPSCQGFIQNADVVHASPEDEAAQSLQSSANAGAGAGAGAWSGAGEAGAALESTTEASALAPGCPAPASTDAAADRSVRRRCDAVSTGCPSAWAVLEPEDKMATIGDVRVIGDAGRRRQAVSMVLAAVVAAGLWYVYVN